MKYLALFVFLCASQSCTFEDIREAEERLAARKKSLDSLNLALKKDSIDFVEKKEQQILIPFEWGLLEEEYKSRKRELFFKNPFEKELLNPSLTQVECGIDFDSEEFFVCVKPQTLKKGNYVEIIMRLPLFLGAKSVGFVGDVKLSSGISPEDFDRIMNADTIKIYEGSDFKQYYIVSPFDVERLYKFKEKAKEMGVSWDSKDKSTVYLKGDGYDD